MNFLEGGDDADENLEEIQLINTKLENLEKIKFDDQKWAIDPTRFIIHGRHLSNVPYHIFFTHIFNTIVFPKFIFHTTFFPQI